MDRKEQEIPECLSFHLKKCIEEESEKNQVTLLRKAAERALRTAFYQLHEGDRVFWQTIQGMWMVKEIWAIVTDKVSRKCRILFRGDSVTEAEIYDEDGDYSDINEQQWFPFVNGVFADTVQVIQTLYPDEKLLLFVPTSSNKNCSV